MEKRAFPRREQTMRHRLLGYMLVLIAVVLSAVLAGLSLMGRFSNDKRDLTSTLELQLDVWEKELRTHSDALVAMGTDLSGATSRLVDQNLRQQGIAFGELEGSGQAQAKLQEALMPMLREYLLRTEASGAYIMLNTTVSPGGEERFGVYLQRHSLDPTDNAMLLYRGKASVGKELGIMPHRKWKLEMRGDAFLAKEQQNFLENRPSGRLYRYSSVCTLPGTSERAVLLKLPIHGKDGSFLGICGFEISQSFFKLHHAQPAIYPRLSFLLTTPQEEGGPTELRLSAGTSGDYFFDPPGKLSVSRTEGALTEFRVGGQTFVGLHRPLGGSAVASVMLPGEAYDHMVRSSFLQTALLIALMAVFAVACCVFFSQKYLLPILRGLERMKDKSAPEESGVQEIDDLFSVLMQEDRRHREAMQVLTDEKESAQNRMTLIQKEYDKIRLKARMERAEPIRVECLDQVDRDSEEYRTFLRGLSELTAKEREILQHYLTGRTVKEIEELMHIKETTLRYHNRNIYSKLGVHSMKQLLRFAVYVNEQQEENL